MLAMMVPVIAILTIVFVAVNLIENKRLGELFSLLSLRKSVQALPMNNSNGNYARDWIFNICMIVLCNCLYFFSLSIIG